MTDPKPFTCSICLRYVEGEYGNNAWPINNGRCCNDCNRIVIAARIIRLKKTTTASEIT